MTNNDLGLLDRRLRLISVLLYTVAGAGVLLIANYGSWRHEFNRPVTNLLGALALASVLFVLLVPWQRYRRNAFLVMSLSSTALLAVGIYFTGGLNSPFTPYYLLGAIFAALYYGRYVALMMGAVIALSSLMPAVYGNPTPMQELTALVRAATYLVMVFVGNVMATELVRNHRAVQGLSLDLDEARRLRDELQSAHSLEQRRVAALLALQRSGAVLHANEDAHAAMHSILDELVNTMGYQYVSIYELVESELRLVSQRGYEDVAERLDLSRGVMARAVRQQRTEFVPDVESDPDFIAKLPGLQSEICVPLFISGQVSGVINVETLDRRLDYGDLELLELFGQQASSALADARQHHQRVRAERRAVAASKLLAELNRYLLVDQVLRAATRDLVMPGEETWASIWMPSESERSEWLLRAGPLRGAPTGGVHPAIPFVVLSGQNLLVRDARHSPQFVDPEWARQERVNSMVLCRMVRGDELLGVFCVASDRFMDDQDFEFYRMLAGQVSLALDRAFAYDRDRHRTQQLEVVHDIGRDIAAVLDPIELCRTLAATLRSRLHYSIVTVFVADSQEGHLMLVAHQGLRDQPEYMPLTGLQLPPGQGIVGRVATTGQPYYTSDVRKDPYYESLGHSYIRSELAVPMFASGQLRGVLNVESERLNAFDEVDVMTLEAVADHAAVALVNARTHVRLSEQASVDILTGVFNHRALMERVDAEVERARRFNRSLALMFFDIDHFKAINDTYGHQAGDIVLREVSQLITGCLRLVDTIGRYGGEEFVAVLTEADAVAAAVVAERVRSSVAGREFSLGDGVSIRLTISIGLACLPQHGESRQTLLRSADRAMYRAKKLGRNQVCTFDEWEPMSAGADTGLLPGPLPQS